MKHLPIFLATCLRFLSGCVVMTTYETRPSVTEKATIRMNCISSIYNCEGGCPLQNDVYNSETEAERHIRKEELGKCMTHYQEQLRNWYFNQNEYPLISLNSQLEQLSKEKPQGETEDKK